MASPGEPLRNYWTADFYNRLNALLGNGGSAPITTSGPLSAAGGKKGTQIVAPPNRSPLSTIQGYVVGGTAPAVSDGTEVIDAYAWGAYSIQAAYFVLSAGTTTVTVKINGTAVSWLNGISVSTTPTVIKIAVPVPNLSHVVPVGGQLTIVTSSSSGASGLAFSFNVPF